MAISRLASQDAQGTGTGTFTVTYPGATTSGNLLLAIVGDNDGLMNRTTVTSNAGTVVWKIAGGGNESSTNELQIFAIIAAGTETAISINLSTGIIGNAAIYEYIGITTAGIAISDKNASGGSLASNTASTGTTSTTSFSNELLFVSGFSTGIVETFTSWSNSFNLRNTVAQTTSTLFTGDQIVSAKAAYTSTLTVSSVATAISTAIATFKGTSQGGPSPLSILGAG